MQFAAFNPRRLFSVAAVGLAVFLSACGMDKYPTGEWDEVACTAEGISYRGGPKQRAASLLLEQALEDDKGLGVSAAVTIDGKLVWSHAAGGSGHGAHPLTASTKMRVGSLAKPLTAALAAHLYEIGVLDIDAPIQSYVPAYPEKQLGIVTVKNLASHTSGVRQYDFSNFSESNSTVHYEHLVDALGVFSADPLLFSPGEKYHYSSLGYNLIGAAIEEVLDVSYGEAMREYITERYGMDGTRVDDPKRHTKCRARFSTVMFGTFAMNTLWRDHSDAYSSAGMLSTPEDLAVFVNQVFNTEERSPGSLDLFSSEVSLKDGSSSTRTFGWEVHRDEKGDVEWYGHGGTTNGAFASIRYYPKTKMVVTGIANYNFFPANKYPRFLATMREDIPAVFDPTE